ncbi:Ppx/GppA family phosphatase [Nocardioides immobilis]|uniref:Ppx/GppA family phosphatase n=1 Tax=Nocardioides immobilis TaxID=2049295 RepID=A0A417Y4X7_9ACTN|nr:Ppx/GppA phosphatase family protein [Nocardioides immobilis]RHW27738.1 Ppx/GppA family phosphatase [Nocardioides immobilis]
MTTVAAIDCGTNTIKLLIGDLPEVAVRESRMVRLGQGVDATGRLAPEALERAFAAIDEYAALIADHRAQRIRFCATSATRDAENAAEFTAGVRARLGIEPEVLSGDEEARLAFGGAVQGTDPQLEPVLVVDIGGGSTELILGERATGPRAAYSMDIGSVRLHERVMGDDPATPDQVSACVAAIDAALDDCPVDPAAAAAVIGIAGTITTVAAGVLGLPAYDRELIHGQVLDVDAVHRTVDDLVGATRDERLGLGYVHPGRADVIDAGALILSRVLRRTALPTMTVAETDILDGIAWSLVG